MKKKQQKAITIVLVILLLLLSIGMTVGCVEKDKKLETETFRYHIFDAGDHKEVFIDGLTEKGRQQKNIVIPEEIDGMPVTSLRGHSEAPNLKKIIVSCSVDRINSFAGLSQGSLFVHGYLNWPKIIYVNCNYVESAVFPSVNGYLATNAEESFSKHYGDLWGFHFANMQYLFNYEDSPNKGVSFVDDLDIGEKLEIIPATPKRDGYTFTGWYAEPECTNKVELNGYVKTDEEIVYLYAGWEENK